MRIIKAHRVTSISLIAAACLLSGCGQEDATKRLNELAIQRLEEQKTPEQRATEAKKAEDLENQKRVHLLLMLRMESIARAMREGAKNPAVFQLVSMVHIEKSDTVCMTYRGTNSFGGVVTEYAAFNPAGKTVDWNKQCANKSGKDWVQSIKL